MCNLLIPTTKFNKLKAWIVSHAHQQVMAFASGMALGKYLTHLKLLKESCFQAVKSIHWMNEKATPDQAYIPTYIEHIANVITHGIGVLPSAYGSFLLLSKSSNTNQFVSAFIYGLSLILCFSVSTLFHTVFFSSRNRYLKEILHRSDRAMIYVFIAASYFPWVFLNPAPRHTLPYHLWWIIWVLAILGILYQQAFHEKYKSLETFFYVLVGVGPSLVFMQYQSIGPGEYQLKMGGLLYMLGVVFFKSDGSIPCAHAIWHLFVAGAAATHYFAVHDHLYSWVHFIVN